MEISGKVLREVEFRDRLRGYDTDEVDEFLEKVALGIDEFRAELEALREQAATAPAAVQQEPARVPETSSFDDDSIRRTLVLAQRTADLAISEAREEASRISEEARNQSEALVTQATETARRVRDEAEFEAHERLDRLNEQSERLERDIHALASLVSGERERLITGLQSALHFVGETLSLSEELANHAEGRDSQPVERKGLDQVLDLPDVEAEIDADATEAFPPQRTTGEASEPADPDEALWARWAQGASLGDEPPPRN